MFFSSNMVFNPEIELIIKCCQFNSELQSGDVEKINWEVFFDLIEQHRVLPEIYPKICLQESVPTFVKEKIKQVYSDNKIKLLSYSAELLSILRILNTKGILAIPVKGPFLSYRYFKDFTQRDCQDLDILIDQENIEKATLILEKEGYKLQDEIYQTPKQKNIYLDTFHHYCMYSNLKGILVELHWRLLPSQEAARVFSNQEIWKNAIELETSNFKVELLSKFDNFLHLCLHGSAHNWKRLFWVYDIAMIIHTEGPEFVNQTYKYAQNKKVVRHFLQALDIAGYIFDIQIPEQIKKQIGEDKTNRILTQNAIYFIETQRDQTTFFEKIEKYYRHFSSINHLSGFSYVLKEIKLFTINPRNWAVYSFPDYLFYLNFPAAPFLWIYRMIFHRFLK